ncbi:Helicase [Trypanosoma melophagium]|uniref:Helicase n=2 Tax=Trypanosoma melophagium TaxID=715481 RepID=UPI003519FA25|nr:Helicase [Trypanosoma melophagium]
MRKTFVRLSGGFQPPRTVRGKRHSSPPQEEKEKEDASLTNTNTNPSLHTTASHLLHDLGRKRTCLESSSRHKQYINTQSRSEHTSSTAAITIGVKPLRREEGLLSSSNEETTNSENVDKPRECNHSIDQQTPEQRKIEAIIAEEKEKETFENEEKLQREMEEDLRLSADLAFTPRDTGQRSSACVFSQQGIEEDAEYDENIEDTMNTNSFHFPNVKGDGHNGVVLFAEGENGTNPVYPNTPSSIMTSTNNTNTVVTNFSGKTIKGSSKNSSGAGGGFYDLPYAAQSFFNNRCGIKQLYPWQHEVLMRDDIRNGGSLVYSLPTSGGKTLVAEISLLRCLLNSKKSCFFVLPFVSLAEEKTEGLRLLGDTLGFAVDGHYGTQGRLPLPKRTAAYVCTIEKANSLLNHMLEEGLTEEIGCIVVDELHMLGESRRGATLELFLSKVLCLSHPVQIIGMSATIPNLPSIAKWLRASCYLGEYRPVPLRQYAVIEGMVVEDGERNERNLLAAGYSTEVEQLVFLATEVSDASVLIFCASRQQCIDTAHLIARYRKEAMNGYTGAKDSIINGIVSELDSLSHDTSLLSHVIPYGVAFHHGGLLSEERELIERAYRQRHLNILCCTSTLAAGVNLPARRVIFKTPYVGRDFLTKSRYLQMCGRAGRAGLDEFGESFLLLSRKDCKRGRELMQQDVEMCSSKMLEEASAFERAILECIALGIIHSPSEARKWISNLLCHNAPGPFDAVYDASSRPLPVVLDNIFDSALNRLVHFGLVRRLPQPTVDESVTTADSIEEALLVREELEQLQRTGLILADDLHLCYFLTPLREIGDCNWVVYRDILSRLNENRQRIANMVGVDEYLVYQRAMGLSDSTGSSAINNNNSNNNINNNNSNTQLFTTRRFFVALMLADLLGEVPLCVVEQRYQCNRGQLQGLMRSASMFSSSITAFCRAMEWFALEAVLAAFVKRLGFGVKPDIVPLMELRGVQPGRARALWAAGFRDPASIAACGPEEVLRRVKATVNTSNSNSNSNNSSGGNRAAKFFTLRAAVAIVREANLFVQRQIREKKGELMELTMHSRLP